MEDGRKLTDRLVTSLSLEDLEYLASGLRDMPEDHEMYKRTRVSLIQLELMIERKKEMMSNIKTITESQIC